MFDFIISLISIIGLFAFSMGLAYSLNLVKQRYFNEKTPPKGSAKIYYVTNYEKRKKPRVRKEPQVALSGVLLKPEQFQRLYVNQKI